jgi:hypothetical protein
VAQHAIALLSLGAEKPGLARGWPGKRETSNLYFEQYIYSSASVSRPQGGPEKPKAACEPASRPACKKKDIIKPAVCFSCASTEAGPSIIASEEKNPFEREKTMMPTMVSQSPKNLLQL